MKIPEHTKIQLASFVFESYNTFNYIKDFKKNSLNTILYKNFIDESYIYLNNEEIEQDRLYNNNINRLIKYCLNKCNIDDALYTNTRNDLLHRLNSYNIVENDDISNIVCNSKKLYELCKYIVENYRVKTDKNSYDCDPGAEEDYYLFQYTVTKIFNKNKSESVVQKATGYGQQLKVDTLTKINDKIIVLDSKFVDTELLISNKKNEENIKYRYYSNNYRFQVNSYIDAYKYSHTINENNILGIICHAVTSEMYAKFEMLNHKSVNIGNNKIFVELIIIDKPADSIIKQIKDIKEYYSNI